MVLPVTTMSRSIRWSVVVLAALVGCVSAVGVAAAQSADVCRTVAPGAVALKKALGAGSFAPISNPGPPPYCGVAGAGATSARIYLYPKGAAAKIKAQLGAAFPGRAPRKQSLIGLGSGATIEYVPGDTSSVLVYFTAGSHFIVITGSSTKNAQIVALARAVRAKLV